MACGAVPVLEQWNLKQQEVTEKVLEFVRSADFSTREDQG